MHAPPLPPIIGVALLAAAAVAQAQQVSLYPPCPPFECGDSRQLAAASRPSTPILWEEQSLRVEIAAESLLRDTREHVAVALMAGAQAFAADGSFALPDGPGGGLGVVVGALDADVHPTCPADPDNTQIEFAVERFGWRNPYASTIPVCLALPKSVLDRAPVLELRVGVRCHSGASCSLNAELRDPERTEPLRTLYAGGLQLANPGATRMIWAGVTNIMYDDPVLGARVRVLDQHYHAEP